MLGHVGDLVKDVCEAICRRLTEYRTECTRKHGLDASKLKRELGWEPKHSFDQGIATTVDWYLEHQDWVQRVLDGSYRLERIGGVS